jgi:hypothetical protein
LSASFTPLVSSEGVLAKCAKREPGIDEISNLRRREPGVTQQKTDYKLLVMAVR